MVSFASATHAGFLGVGERYSRSLNVTLPDGLEGSFYLNVRTSGPFEFNHLANNIGHSLAVPVELQITGSESREHHPANPCPGRCID